MNSCTTGFDELKEKVMEYPPERAAEISGIPADRIRGDRPTLASVKPAMLMYTLGITEHTCGVNNVLSCANLRCFSQRRLRVRRRESAGGQNNVQGACDMGALPMSFPVTSGWTSRGAGEVRESLGRDDLPAKPGLMIPG